jgi:DNA-binding transcriptional MerR regulator
VKYYIREGLVPGGARVADNQSQYSEEHTNRIRLIRALIETGQLTISAVKEVLATIDADAPSPAQTFGAAQCAIGQRQGQQPPTEAALTRVRELAAARGWDTAEGNPGLAKAAAVLDGMAAIGFTPPAAYLAAYADAAQQVARADIDMLAHRSEPELVVELMVVGTVLGDALAAGLRWLAHEAITTKTHAGYGQPDRSKDE